MKIETIDEEELTRRLNEMLDEAGAVSVAGLEFWPSAIISELDTTAYREQLNDYADYLSREGVICPDYTGVDVFTCEECGSEYDDMHEAVDCCKTEEE